MQALRQLETEGGGGGEGGEKGVVVEREKEWEKVGGRGREAGGKE